ncbi:LuxR C-terminal-related transcriptional regulator [Microvirga sesbaniae]|uniref:LuxR C-terminal-related transcriptional regulator n=1 Tax=Microvirga sesbaniae TaxID=681392 RepID=UPI0021C6B4AF|nr:response regulator transcription factor [Microvirga sp. HBU67692]
MSFVSLALVDDHPIVIEGLTHVLGSQGLFDVVATGSTSRDAIGIAESLRPALMILDLSKQGSTAGTIAEIRSKHPGIGILVFTADLGVERAIDAFAAGARGYVSKSSSLEELSRAATAVANGDTYVSPTLAASVNAALRSASGVKSASGGAKSAVPAPALNAREHQIVRLLLDGKTNREIAGGLGITERTVKHYMTVLMQKLNVRNRVEAVIAAQNLGRDTAERSKSGAGDVAAWNRPSAPGRRSGFHDALSLERFS